MWDLEVIWVRRETKYFCKRGWTGNLAKHEVICPSGAYSGAYARQAAPRGGGAQQRSLASRLRFWAVETRSHIESRLAINASPTIVPQAPKLRSSASLLLRLLRGAHERLHMQLRGYKPGGSGSAGASSYRRQASGRSHQPHRRLRGTPSPVIAAILIRNGPVASSKRHVLAA